MSNKNEAMFPRKIFPTKEQVIAGISDEKYAGGLCQYLKLEFKGRVKNRSLEVRNHDGYYWIVCECDDATRDLMKKIINKVSSVVKNKLIQKQHG